MGLEIVHVELKTANEFVAKLHRHHKPTLSHRFSVGAAIDGELVGVAIVGRPVAHATDQWNIVEVTRLCTDGSQNACSFLYSACARAARELGYRKIQTFILLSEPGTSLEAAGWELEAIVEGASWHRPGRPRTDKHPTVDKARWAKVLNTGKGYDAKYKSPWGVAKSPQRSRRK